jgi:hypothetical protein
MAVDGGEFHLTKYDRSPYRTADHARTIRKPKRNCVQSEKVILEGLWAADDHAGLDLKIQQSERTRIISGFQA